MSLVHLLDTASASPYKPTETKVYKTVDGTDLTLDIFYPEGHTPDDSSPAIVFFHGGGWRAGTKGHFAPQSDYLAKRGMVAISVEYRLTEKHGTTPQECVKDGKSAMRWVRSHANELGIDPDKILAGGGSAGGHVAAATVMIDAYVEDTDDLSVSCRPAALVLFNPVVDNSSHGYGYDRVKDYRETISPLENVSENLPPMLFLVGSKDTAIPEDSSRLFEQRVEEKGGRCDLIVYEGQEHAFFNYGREYYPITVAAMDDFLVDLGYLEPLPETSEAQ